jgi:hypothetical protein
MAELVACPNTDQPPFGPQGREHLEGHRLSAAVVPDLEYVNVAKSPVANQRVQHHRLRVPRQHRREALRFRLEHDARFVGRGILNRRTRPHDRQLHAPHSQHVSGHYLAHIPRTDQLQRLGHSWRVAVKRARGHTHRARAREPV